MIIPKNEVDFWVFFPIWDDVYKTTLKWLVHGIVYSWLYHVYHVSLVD